MPVILKDGRDLHASALSAPLPTLDVSIPPRVLDMIKLLLRHQQVIAEDTCRTIVLTVAPNGRLAMKVTSDMPA
jgi:hypothetical protein